MKNKSTPPTTTLANEDAYLKERVFANGRQVYGLYATSNSKLIKWLSTKEVETALELGVPVYEN